MERRPGGLELEGAHGRRRPGPRRTAWLLAAFAFVTWWSAIPPSPGFAYDDREAIVGNPVVDGRLPWTAAFERDYWHHLEDAGHYRPLATLLLRFDRARSLPPAGEVPAPRAFRRTNVCLHALVVLVLGLAFARLDRARAIPFPWFGLGVFAVHPAGADVVAWISGRTSLVSALGAAIGAVGVCWIDPSHARRSSWVAGLGAFVGVAVALLGKEDGVVLAAVLPIAAGLLGGRLAAISTLAGSALAVALVMLLRQSALGDAIPSSPSAPLAHVGLLRRVAIGLTAWSEGLSYLLFPWPPATPSLDIREPSLDALNTLGKPLGLLWLLIVAARRLGAERSRMQAGKASLVFALVAIAPLSQLVPAGEIFAPRFLYQPLLVGVFATSALLALLVFVFDRSWLVHLLGVLILIALAWTTQGTSRTYDNRLSYWSAYLPTGEDSARVQNALGEARRELGELDAARRHFRRAHTLRPEYSSPLTNLGTLAMRRTDWHAARHWLERATAVGGSEPVPHANLGNVLLRLDRAADAVEPYRHAVELAPGRAAYHRGLARALLRSGDPSGARVAILRALELAPEDALALRLLESIENTAPAAPISTR